MKNQTLQFVLSLVTMCFAICWYAGLWQRLSLTLMFAMLTMLSCVQVAQKIELLNSLRIRGSSMVSRKWARFSLAIRIAFTLVLATFGIATGMSLF